MPIDFPTIHSKFPALRRPTIFFDNTGGIQVAQPVLDHINAYLVEHNARPSGIISTRPAAGSYSWSATTAPA